MTTVCALVPHGRSLDEAFAAIDGARPAVRLYPQATDTAHVLSLVRAGRDRVATRWLRGLAFSVVGGALLGCATATTLALGFEMFGGLVGVAIGFGLAVGAFLGGFTAAMTGTERARDEIRDLASHATNGCVLAQIGPFAPGDERLARLRSRLDELDWPRCNLD